MIVGRGRGRRTRRRGLALGHRSGGRRRLREAAAVNRPPPASTRRRSPIARPQSFGTFRSVITVDRRRRIRRRRGTRGAGPRPGIAPAWSLLGSASAASADCRGSTIARTTVAGSGCRGSAPRSLRGDGLVGGPAAESRRYTSADRTHRIASAVSQPGKPIQCHCVALDGSPCRLRRSHIGSPRPSRCFSS